MDAPRLAPATTAANPFLSGNFAPVEVETTCFDLEVHGRIPEGLHGRFLRIGPNPIGPVDPLRFHWFLGTGMAHGLRLRGGPRRVVSQPVRAQREGRRGPRPRPDPRPGRRPSRRRGQYSLHHRGRQALRYRVSAVDD